MSEDVADNYRVMENKQRHPPRAISVRDGGSMSTTSQSTFAICDWVAVCRTNTIMKYALTRESPFRKRNFTIATLRPH